MSKLPAALPPRIATQPNNVSAYNMILLLEHDLEEAHKAQSVKKLNPAMVHCRVLGYLFHFSPGNIARDAVINDILSTAGDQAELKDLGKMYYVHLLRLLRSNKAQTPVPTNHVSRPSFDTLADMINDILEQPLQSYAASKNKALARDGFRCVVTGAYDGQILKKNSEVRARAKAEGIPSAPTQCCHIFPDSTNAGIEGNDDKRNYAATAWAIIERFGYKNIVEELLTNARGIHRLENLLTMRNDIHAQFDALDIWFSAKPGQPHTYTIEASDPQHILLYPKVVTFTTPDAKKLPLPSPRYLEIHAACAKIAHLSGAAEYMEDILRDLELIPVLAYDGSSAEALEHLLIQATSRAISV